MLLLGHGIKQMDLGFMVTQLFRNYRTLRPLPPHFSLLAGVNTQFGGYK